MVKKPEPPEAARASDLVSSYVTEVSRRWYVWEQAHSSENAPWYQKAFYPIQAYFALKQIRFQAFFKHLYLVGRKEMRVNDASWRDHFLSRLRKEFIYHRQLVYAFFSASPFATALDGAVLTAGAVFAPITAAMMMLSAIGLHAGLVQMIDIAHVFQTTIENKGEKYKEVDAYLRNKGYAENRSFFQNTYQKMRGKTRYIIETYRDAIASYKEYEIKKNNWDSFALSPFQHFRLNLKVGTRVMASLFRANTGCTGVLFGLLGFAPLSGLTLIGLPFVMIPFSLTDAAAFYKREVENERANFTLQQSASHQSFQPTESKGWKILFGKNIANSVQHAKEATHYQDKGFFSKSWFQLKMVGKLCNSFFDVSPVTVGLLGIVVDIAAVFSGPFALVPLAAGLMVCAGLAYMHKKDVVMDFDRRITETVVKPANAMLQAKVSVKSTPHLTAAHIESEPEYEPYRVPEKTARSNHVIETHAGALDALSRKRGAGDPITTSAISTLDPVHKRQADRPPFWTRRVQPRHGEIKREPRGQ